MTSATTYYERRLADPAYRVSRERKARLIYAICAEPLAGARVAVDLGTGTGIIRRTLEELSGRSILGFEIDRAFLEDAERTAVGDLLDLPIADGTVDFAMANHVYEHVADLDRFLAEVRRVLAPGGAVYLTAGNRFAPIEPHYRIPTLSWWPEPVATRILRWSGRGDRYDDIRFTTHAELARAGARNGLALEDRTDEVLATLLDRYRSRVGRTLCRAARTVPGPLRRRLLRWLSPQWFFFVRHAHEVTR